MSPTKAILLALFAVAVLSQSIDLSRCPEVDLVFLYDLSNSMSDEGKTACDSLGALRQQLINEGIGVSATENWAIGKPGDWKVGDTSNFECVLNNVNGTYLTEETVYFQPDLPSQPRGTAYGVCPWPNDKNHGNDENWAAASSNAAVYFPWTRCSMRVVIPFGDESGCHGSGGSTSAAGVWPCPLTGGDTGCCATGAAQDDNREYLVGRHAGNIASEMGVSLFPISGDVPSQNDFNGVCMEDQMSQMVARATPGSAFLKDVATDQNTFVNAIKTQIETLCQLIANNEGAVDPQTGRYCFSTGARPSTLTAIAPNSVIKMRNGGLSGGNPPSSYLAQAGAINYNGWSDYQYPATHDSNSKFFRIDFQMDTSELGSFRPTKDFPPVFCVLGGRTINVWVNNYKLVANDQIPASRYSSDENTKYRKWTQCYEWPKNIVDTSNGLNADRAWGGSFVLVHISNIDTSVNNQFDMKLVVPRELGELVDPNAPPTPPPTEMPTPGPIGPTTTPTRSPQTLPPTRPAGPTTVAPTPMPTAFTAAPQTTLPPIFNPTTAPPPTAPVPPVAPSTAAPTTVAPPTTQAPAADVPVITLPPLADGQTYSPSQIASTATPTPATTTDAPVITLPPLADGQTYSPSQIASTATPTPGGVGSGRPVAPVTNGNSGFIGSPSTRVVVSVVVLCLAIVAALL